VPPGAAGRRERRDVELEPVHHASQSLAHLRLIVRTPCSRVQTSMIRCVAQVEPERVRRLALLIRVGDVHGHAGQLGVALPGGRIVGPAVQREARIAQQVEGLHAVPHRADQQLAVLDSALDAGDARRAVAADGGDRLVGVRVETLAHARRQVGRGGFEL
jgi:hypothetical protein